MATYRWASAYQGNVQKNGTWSASTGNGYDAISNVADGTTTFDGPSSSTSGTANIYKDTTGSGNYILYDVVKPLLLNNERLWRVVPRLNTTSPSLGKFAVGAWVYGETESNPTGTWFSKGKTSFTGTTTNAWAEGAGIDPYNINLTFGDEIVDYGHFGDTDYESYYNQWQKFGFAVYDSVVNIGNKTTFFEAGLRFEWTVKPTTTGVTVVGASSTNYPTFTWTYGDTDSSLGGEVNGYSVYIYTQATTVDKPGAYGVSSEPAVYNYSVGDVTSTSHTVLSNPYIPPLEYNVGYKVYIASLKKMPNGVLVYGDYASPVNFTITALPPAAPVVTSTWDGTNNEVDVTVNTGYNRMSSQNSSGEDDTSSIGDWTGITNLTTGNITNSSTVSGAHGARAFRCAPTAAGTILALSTQRIDVEEGATYYLRGSSRSTTAARTTRIGARWYTSTGSVISTTYGSGISNSTSAFVEATASLAAPTGAVYANVVFESQATGSNVDYQYIDKLQFCNQNVAWSNGADTATTTLQRSSDGGLNWVDVFNGSSTDPSIGRYWVIDKGAPRGVTCSYRAQSSVTFSTFDMSSAYSTTVTAATTNDSTWWLQAADSRGVNRVIYKVLTNNIVTLTTENDHGYKVGDSVRVVGAGTTFNGLQVVTSVPTTTTFTYSKTAGNVTGADTWGYVYPDIVVSGARVMSMDSEVVENIGVFRPLGSTRPAVINGSIYGADGSMNIMTTTQSEWDALDNLVLSQHPWIVQDPFGNTIWLRITDRSWSLNGKAAAPYREVNLQYVEIAPESSG